MRAAADTARRPAAEDWRVLHALCVYRLLLVPLLVALYYGGIAPRLLGTVEPALFKTTAAAYFAAGVVLVFLTWSRKLPLSVTAAVQAATDIVAVVLIVLSSGGVPSGLGILLIAPTLGYALVLPARLAALMAALAALALLGEEIYRQLPQEWNAAAFTETGILGSIFFLTALGANVVASRARRSEAQVERVGSELLNLSRINDIIVENMRTGVVVADIDGRVRLLNVAARRLLDAPHAAPGDGLDRLATGLWSALKLWRRNGVGDGRPLAPRPGAAELIPRFTRLGERGTALTLVLLEDAAQLREDAQRMKLASLGRLSASIAHEIRNPLSAISHASQLLTEAGGGGEDARLLQMIQRHCQRIDKIIRDVLDLSRREAAEPDAIELTPWLRNAATQYQEAFALQSRPIEIGAFPAGLRVRFAAQHLQQVLTNLWDNSFDHGGNGVRVRVIGGRLSGGAPFLDVADNGPGISPQAREHIFDPFFTTTRQGTGLGLYLARELCEYNHAQLDCRPAGKTGACFRLTFMEAGAAQ